MNDHETLKHIEDEVRWVRWTLVAIAIVAGTIVATAGIGVYLFFH